MGKILIIGEKAGSRTLLGEELAGEGHTVAITGTAALTGEFLFTLGPDVVLLDLRLNRLDQWWVVDEVKRQAPQVSVLPYISCSGEEEEFTPGKIGGYVEVLKRQVSGVLQEKYTRHLGGQRMAYRPANLNLAFKGQG